MTDGFVGRFSTAVMLLATDYASDDAVQILSEISHVGKTPGKKLRAPRLAMAAVAVHPRTLQMPSKMVQAEVFARDRYTCRYCGRRTIAVPVMNAVSALNPKVFRCHPNWKADETDVAVLGMLRQPRTCRSGDSGWHQRHRESHHGVLAMQ